MRGKKVVKMGSLALLALLLIALPLLGGCAPKEEAPPTPEEEKWVKVGISLALSGPLATTHAPDMRSFLSGCRMINDKGGIEYKDPKTGKIGHVKIDALWADDKYSVDLALSNYTRWVDAGAIAFFHGNTATDIALREIAARDKILVIHGGMTPATIYPKWPKTWSINPGTQYVDCFGCFVDWVMENWKEARAPKLGFLTVDIPFAKAPITDPAIAYMKDKGMEYVGVQFYGIGDVDVTPQLSILADAGADWVFHNFTVEGYALVCKGWASLELQDKMNLCSNMLLYNKTAVILAKEAAEGAYGVLWSALPEDTHLPGVKLMIEQTLKNYPDDEITSNNFDGWMYFFTLEKGLKAALEEVGYPVTGEDFARAVMSADGTGIWADTGGCFPPLDFTTDPKDANGFHQMRMAQVQNGEIVPLTDWMDLPHLSYVGLEAK